MQMSCSVNPGIITKTLTILQTLHVDALDSESADLLSHWPRTCEFLTTAIDEGGIVYVHCAAGVSRSGAVSPYTLCVPLIP